MTPKVPRRKPEHVIQYQVLPQWSTPAVWTVCTVLSIAVLLWHAPLFVPTFTGWIMGVSSAVLFEALLRTVAVCLLSFVAYSWHEAARNETVLLTEDGMHFPQLLAPDLLFRRKRTWDDIGNILLGAMLFDEGRGTYEFDLETSKDRRKMFIYFLSGGHATIDLNRMPKKSVEKLFQSIESWCLASTRAPQGGEIKSKRPKNQKFEELSYTRMWEEELYAQFSTTNFVPLDKDESLQNDKYIILMQLSTGGLSAVYLAETGNDRDLVVVKEAAVPPGSDSESSSKIKEMFDREVRILRKLKHPNIARVVDNFIEHGREYMILEFVPGESLRQVVKKKGVLSERTVLEYALKLARILDFLHDQKPPVVHRDLTPDNIVLRDDGELVVIDFGAANLILGTATGTMVGKQAYISPEQFKGKACPASDLYSLGGTLQFLLTGKDPVALAVSHPKSTNNGISDELDQVVASCTEVDVSKRIQSADALIELLVPMLPATSISLGKKPGKSAK